MDSITSLTSRSSSFLIRTVSQVSTSLTDQHINLLMSKSCCGHDVIEDDSTREHVLNAYKFLSSDPLLSPILHIVASSTKIKSVFDFNRDSVHMVDPTVSSETKGMFYLSGRVYIGAKQLLDESTKIEVYATLAHEFCHYAVDLIYGNFAKPYAKNDTKTREKFEKISQKCKLQVGIEEYIDIVYNYYPPEMHHAELIVRVPHLIALYSHDPERLKLIRETFKELFEFYEKKINPEMQKAWSKIEAHDQLKEKEQKILKLRIIACISFSFTLVAIIVVLAFTCWYNQPPQHTYSTLSPSQKSQIQNSTIIYKNIEVKFFDLFPNNSTAYYALTSNHISKILDGQYLNFSDHRFLYLCESIYHDWQNLTKKLKQKFLTSNFTFQNESLRFEKMEEISPDVFKSLSSEQIVDVLDGKELKVGNMIEDKIYNYIERRFVKVKDDEGFVERHRVESDDQDESEDATEENREDTTEVIDTDEAKILVEKNLEVIKNKAENEERVKSDNKAKDNGEQNIEETKLAELQEVNLDLAESLIKPKRNQTNLEMHKYRILENINRKSNDSPVINSKTTQAIIQQTLNDRIFILDSEIGAGKTVIFKKLTISIKKAYPTRWVSFIDLNYKNIFENLLKFNESLENISSQTDEIIENIIEFLGNILDIDKSNKFETAIFKQSFKLGNIVLLWDSYDLIPKKSREIITNLFKLIHNHTENVQFISSMPLFVNQLRQSLGSHIYQPIRFTESEQKEFLRNFFTIQNLSNEKIENFTQVAFELSKTLQLDSPLMQKFIAENFDPESQNLYEICDKFVTQKIENWNESEGGKNFSLYLLSRSSNNFNMMDMYQKVAFQQELDLNLATNLLKPEFKHLKNLKILKIEFLEIVKVEEIARMGILRFRSNSDWSFVHKTLADFFFSKYFIDNLYIVDDTVSETEIELRKEIFKYLLKNYSRKEMVLRLIREHLKEKVNDTNTSKDFFEIINQF